MSTCLAQRARIDKGSMLGVQRDMKDAETSSPVPLS